MTNGFYNLKLSEAEKSAAVKEVVAASSPKFLYFLMLGCAICMATLGLFLDNASIVIGSMLLAPVMSPVITMAMGVVMADTSVIRFSVNTLIRSVVVGIGVSAVIALFASIRDYGLTDEIMSRTEPNLELFLVALIAGFAASVALVKEEVSKTLPGVAISVALVPPLAVVGIGLAEWDMQIFLGSFLLFLINVLGIAMAAIVTFSLMNFYGNRGTAKRAVDNEIKEINGK